MRQRKIKNVEEKIEAFSDLIVEDPASLKGNWKSAFDVPSGVSEQPEKLFAEFGCGKGKFMRDLSVIHPDYGFICFEGHKSVVYHALQKADSIGAANIRFVTEYIDLAGDYFDEGELSGIYLNFSDPWPKPRHEKRRLTAGKKLEDYVRIVEKGGSIEFRTDNDELFDYTMDQLTELAGARIVAVSRDLHQEREDVARRIDAFVLEEAAFEEGLDDEQDSLRDLLVTSEYEDKFSEEGKAISYVRLEVI